DPIGPDFKRLLYHRCDLIYAGGGVEVNSGQPILRADFAAYAGFDTQTDPGVDFGIQALAPRSEQHRGTPERFGIDRFDVASPPPADSLPGLRDRQPVVIVNHLLVPALRCDYLSHLVQAPARSNNLIVKTAAFLQTCSALPQHEHMGG